MDTLRELFEKNRAWAARTVDTDPEFFTRLTAQQAPRYLWIGCADSRVPANEIVGMRPGELCHLVVPEDLDLDAGVIRVRNKAKLVMWLI